MNIKINFEGDTLNVKQYNADHCVPGSICLNADKVVEALRATLKKDVVASAHSTLNMWAENNISSSSQSKTKDKSADDKKNEFGSKKSFL